jgi:hypothetical protein
MRLLAPLLVVLLLGVSGCMSKAGTPQTTTSGATGPTNLAPPTLPLCEAPAVHMVPPPESLFAQATDPNQRYDVLFYYPTEKQPFLSAVEPPPGWYFGYKELASDATNGTLLRVTLESPAGGDLPPWDRHPYLLVNWTSAAQGYDECRPIAEQSGKWLLDPPAAGERVRSGKGAYVRTAGFWDNGTLFYTNIQEVQDDAAWPRAGWYTYNGSQPLPVYVYEVTPQERDILWGPPTIGGVTLWTYYTTIPGFNEVLKTMSTNSVRVVRIAPEDAYTRPGNENHPLYGDALTFFIQVIDVVDVPCPQPPLQPPQCDLPPLPLADQAGNAEYPAKSAGLWKRNMLTYTV